MSIKLSSGGSWRGEQGLFGALADPNRRAVLALLRRGSRTAGELGAGLPVTKATLSHHLNVLKSAGLVRAVRRGRERIYSVNTSGLEELGGALAARFDRRALRGAARLA